MTRTSQFLWRASMICCALCIGELPACSSGSGSPRGPGLGGDCSFQPCFDGLCYNSSFCTRACTSDADCDGLSCGILPDGNSYCIPGCNDSYFCVAGCNDSYTAPPDFACDGSRPVACSQAGPNHCEDCGCSPGFRCDRGSHSCEPLRDVGGDCDTDSDCRTNNCSTYAGICRVAVGAACNADNCDRCKTTASGWSYCSRRCGGGDFDGDCNGGHCLGNAELSHFWCMPPCSNLSDTSCPDRCFYSSSGESIYCDCRAGTCDTLSSPRDEGQWCEADGQCLSGDCYFHGVCASSSFNSCSRVGWCAAEGCAGGCADGTVCADVPCTGTDDHCGARCLPTCEDDSDCKRGNLQFPGLRVGSCRALSLRDGGMAQVCDVNQQEGASCATDGDCISGSCVSRRCGPSGGNPNGGACSVASDCASGQCVTGQCRGSGLIGDVCTVPADCAVGTCCGGRCATSC